MTKIAAIGLPTLLGVGLSLAGGLVSMASQRSHQKKQEEANRDWMAFQDQKTREFNEREAANREKSQAELNANLDQSDQASREDVIANEEARLSDVFGGSDEGLANLVSAQVGAGQGGGTSEVFDKHMAASMADASADAKKRIQAMARTTAYGGGSMGGMGMTDMLRNLQSQNVIGGVNSMRDSDRGILERWQTVQPEVLEYGGSPLGSALSAFGGAIGGGMFGGLGGGGGATTTVATPTIKPFQPTPMTGPVPTFNPMAPR